MPLHRPITSLEETNSRIRPGRATRAKQVYEHTDITGRREFKLQFKFRFAWTSPVVPRASLMNVTCEDGDKLATSPPPPPHRAALSRSLNTPGRVRSLLLLAAMRLTVLSFGRERAKSRRSVAIASTLESPRRAQYVRPCRLLRLFHRLN